MTMNADIKAPKPFPSFCFLGYVFMLFLLSCSSKDSIPADVIEFNKMKQVLWDNTKAQVYAKEILSKDSLKNDTVWYNAMKEKILQHYHVTNEQYERSYRYYSQHPELFIRLTDSIIKQQSEIPNKVNSRKPAFFNEGRKKINKEYE